MVSATVRRRLIALRQPRQAVRLARVLWVVWAIAVWNVVFDHVIVVAGRDYIQTALRAAAAPSASFANMDEWMRPAITHGLWTATAAGAAVLLTGLLAVSLAGRRSGRPAQSLTIQNSSR